MKRAVRMMICVMLAMLSSVHNAAGQESPDRAAPIYVVSGIVKDAITKRRLENVNVYLSQKAKGTVTNANGVFSLKAEEGELRGGITFSHVGYINRLVPETKIEMRSEEEMVVYMMPAKNVLSEVVVYGGDGREIVEEAIRRIPQNYQERHTMSHAFYRETIQKRNTFIAISEAMMDMYKTDYRRREIAQDRIRITRGRRLLSQKARDTLAVKIEGGPYLALLFDVAKNPEALFDDETLPLYTFKQDHLVMIDDRMHFAITFEPRYIVGYPLYYGTAYIDCEDYTISRIEMSLDTNDRIKATRMILQKKPQGLRFKPMEVSLVIAYMRHGGKASLNYVRNTIRFKCDWKRRLFSSAYATTAELVTVEIDDGMPEMIPYAETYRRQHVFYDKVDDFADNEFWKDYNILEPTESLEKAVGRLLRQKRK